MPLRIAIFVAGLISSVNADSALTVMTYNVHHGEGGDGRVDLRRIAELIRSSHPDVVCLQELDKGCERTGRIDMPAELAKLLGMHVVFGANLKYQGGDYGNATLSRYEIVESENIPLPYVEGGERRGCLRTRLRVEGRLVDVFNTHLDLIQEARLKQTAAISDNVKKEAAVILAGDFNERITGPAMRVLTGRFLEVFQQDLESTLTTLVGSQRRIDFILVSPEITVLDASVVATEQAKVASDHLPVVARLALPTAAETAIDKGIQVEDERVERAVIR